MKPGDIDDNESCWLAELPAYDPLPCLSRDVVADLAIIGGGLTGVSTAWHASERWPSRRIVLLEARTLANGASGRNGGQVLNGINGADPRDEVGARRIYQATGAGIDILERLAAASTLNAAFTRHGCLEIATSQAGAERAHQRVERFNAWGIPLRFLAGAEVGLHGAHGAVLDPRAGRANVAAIVRGLRDELIRRGVEIYENTLVSRVEEGPVTELTAGAHTVRAPALVLATNAYTPALGYFRSGVLPLHSHVVATSPLSPQTWEGIGWPSAEGFSDDFDRIAYGARTAGGRLLFGGGANAAYTYRFGGSTIMGRTPAKAFAAVERRLGDYVPSLDVPRSITHRWSGLLAITYDRVCSIGVIGAHDNIYYALGYSGHGLALAALAGRVLCDLHAGEHDAWRDLPFYQRRLAPIPAEPLRWIGYQIYTRLTGRSPRRR